MKLIDNTSLFEIILFGKTNPNSYNEWDKKWVRAELKIKLNGFTSHQTIQLLDEDLIRFYNSIKETLKDFSNPIVFNTLEESILLNGIVEPSGQVKWSGHIVYPINDGNKLLFRFETELAQVDNLYNDLQKELKLL